MKDELIVKICKKVIVVFGILTAFNFIMLISGKSYALFTRTITTNDPVIHIETAKELPEVILVDEIKSKLVKYQESSQENFSGGVVAVNSEGTLYNENNNETIREYRYNGPNVNNYVIFNDEKWRIVGFFKEDNEEFVKIVKNEYLPGSILPDKYKIGETTYNIKDAYSEDEANWNDKENGDANNDWTTAGLQYYLNTEQDDSKVNKGYLSYLSNDAKNMIRETTYYLGNVGTTEIYAGAGMTVYYYDSTIASYNHERENTLCASDVDSYSYGQNEDGGCSIWYGNKVTWPGKIGLLYPSDLGYSTLEKEWNIPFKDGDSFEKTTLDFHSSWLYDIDGVKISPSSTSTYTVVGSSNNNALGGFVYPCLYLKKEVKTIKGTGEKENPYQLSEK